WSRTPQWSDNRLAVACPGGELAVFRMPERELERTFPQADRFALSPTGDVLLLCSESGDTTCVRIADGQTLWTLQLPPGVRDVDQAMDSSESYAVVACESELFVLSFERQAILHRLSHPKRIHRAQFVKGTDGLSVISACADGGIRLWDMKSG